MATTHLPVVGGHPQGPSQTLRTDDWKTGPMATFLFLTFAIFYLTWAAFQGDHYWAGSYLSPLYSPLLFTLPTAPGAGPLEHAWFGLWPGWWPGFLPASPALLILPFPASFRFTCYYYRKAYYRSFGGSPTACTVTPRPQGTYKGETSLLLFQNLHRYALYMAIPYIPILYYDAYVGFFRDGELGVGIGSIVLLINATLLAGYTFGCHSFRHLIGGHDDCMSGGSQGSLKLSAWRRATWCNERHMKFAWVSLFWVMFTDFYVRMVSMGVITDLNTWS